MPSQSTLDESGKTKLKNAIGTSSNKIHYAALARIYYAYPDTKKWSYAGLQGGLAFVLNNTTKSLHFQMVDLDGTRGVIWEHELYDGFLLNQDRAFFLSFEGDVSCWFSSYLSSTHGNL
jgi:Wiskott-Aldrich syndrome protein